MNFGIMQGRLTKAPLDRDLDWFPDHNWSEEFSLAHSIGFDHIELIIDRYKSKYNPILADDGKKKIKELSLKYAVNINHVCINSIIEETILSDMTLCDIKKRLIDISELNIKNLILPLFGKSEINKYNYQPICNQILKIYFLAKDKNIKILLESDLPIQEQIKLLNKYLNKTDIGLVYDVGNACSAGRNVLKEINIGIKYIQHIHIKDKNLNKKNVNLGDGIVNFYELVPFFKGIHENITFTLETDRGSNPTFTQSKNLEFLNKLV